MNLKVSKLISRVHETKFLEQHELCYCKYRLSKIVCNSKQNGILMNVNKCAKIRWLVFLLKWWYMES